MAIQVYKHGEIHEVDGLKCEIITCEIGDYYEHKDAGCVDDVRDLYPDLYKKMDASLEDKNEDHKSESVNLFRGIVNSDGVDLGDVFDDLSTDFLTKNIPMDKSDKNKKK